MTLYTLVFAFALAIWMKPIDNESRGQRVRADCEDPFLYDLESGRSLRYLPSLPAIKLMLVHIIPVSN